MKSTLITIGLLLAALALDLLVPRPDTDRALAAQLLESPVGAALERVDLEGLPVFHVPDRAVVFFQEPGKQGPIRGAVVIQGDRIVRLALLKSREGLAQNELHSTAFLASFQGQAAKPPLDVSAVSGATVSSQILLDAVNQRLKQWRSYVESR